MTNPFTQSEAQLSTKAGNYTYFKLDSLSQYADISTLPFSIRILLESCLRNVDGFQVTKEDVIQIAQWQPNAERGEMPFKPGRVILQDFTGVPAVVDLAALRSAMQRMGGDPKKINPQVPVDLVIDHSVQVDFYGTEDALKKNEELEAQRNKERYEFLHWGKEALDNFRAVPPSTGIVHQVNLEYLASTVMNQNGVAFPDSLVGTDSHTTMINGLGVLGWGVGGIEAEAVMLGQPIFMLTPDVVGFRLTGNLPEGTTATDLVLMIVEKLRQHGVVGKFVEFFGPGMKALSLADRATIANMAPEYGATMGFFPVDEKTLDYLRLSGRDEAQIDLVETYCKSNMLFYGSDTKDPNYTDTLEMDISTTVSSLAGPKRPQDRISLTDMHPAFTKALKAPTKQRGFALEDSALDDSANIDGTNEQLSHGSVVLAAITSCTNTSNPSVLIGAGLVAKKAAEKGMKVPSYVKTSLAPGSRVVTSYLDNLGLSEYFEKLGFYTVGYGCTTCIGNSGPLDAPVRKAIYDADLVVSSVLSGNRNFEGRISPDIQSNYLASPPLVVAYALAGRITLDLKNDPIGKDDSGNDVFLKDIWPTQDEIAQALASLTPKMFKDEYDDVFNANEMWNAIDGGNEDIYGWKDNSTYIQEPPFFEGMSLTETPVISSLKDMRILVKVGDSVTTDHISPAGAIPMDSPTAAYLQDNGVEQKDFNSYGSRRGNDRVMTRGTFGNIRLRNQMAPGTEGGYTTNLLNGEVSYIYDAAKEYAAEGTPLMVLAGKEYGTGSSRDWAAKGTFLLGVKVVLAESFERIHRSNLVGMGVLPLQYQTGQSADSLGLTGKEYFSIPGLNDETTAGQTLEVIARDEDGKETKFNVISRIDTPVEVDYYRNGGILHTVLLNLAKA